MPGIVEIEATVSRRVTFASQQNDVPLIRWLRVHNRGSSDLESLELSLSCFPAFVETRAWRIDRLAAGSSMLLPDLQVSLNAQMLMDLGEALQGELRLVLRHGEEELCSHRVPVELLARNEWGGLSTMPELLAAFCVPNDPAVDSLLSAASRLLEKHGRDVQLDGYASNSSSRVAEMVSAIWHSMCDLSISYALPPASFEQEGQKIRSPSDILKSGSATCLDLALFLAAACEQAGLNPLVVFTEGHAFTGVWLQPQQPSALAVEDAEALRKRFDLHEMLLFETTLLTQRPRVALQQAVRKARAQVDLDKESSFLMALDVRRARMQKIRPLVFSLERSSLERPVTREAGAPSLDLPDVETVSVSGGELTPETRLDRWQRRLLDLSLRNRLLNSPPDAKRVVSIICPDPPLLEDRLADGGLFQVRPLPPMTAGGRSKELYTQRTGDDLHLSYAREALKRSEVVTPLDETELARRLVELYRVARTDLQEGGANTIFLALGFLRWKRSAKEERLYRAPLILLPVELVRRTARSRIALKQREDEVRFNTTLLQLLRQDFEVEIPGLDGELPRDEHGIDVAGVWNSVRLACKDMAGFEVVSDVALGRFSFSKYLMWEVLKNRTDKLSENPVIRHLLHTPTAPFLHQSELKFPEPGRLDQEYAPGELLTPLPADSTQLSAVVACDKGKDFVLIGPPGTGKSQTIANMIAHQMGKGRSVLFVSEKIAALEVVYRRLRELGFGKFCLELHSSKSRKLDVLQQFREALEGSSSDCHDWERESEQLRKLRDSLNGMGDRLLRQHPNGLNVYHAIGDVLRGAGKPEVGFEWPGAELYDAKLLERLREVARRLELYAGKAGPEYQRCFFSVRRGEWAPSWERELCEAAGNLAAAAEDCEWKFRRLLESLGIEVCPATREAAGALARLAEVLPVAHRVKLSVGLHPSAGQVFAALRNGFELLEQYQGALGQLSVTYVAHPWHRVEVGLLTKQWNAAEKKWWPFSFFARQPVIKALMLRGGCQDKPDCARDLASFGILEDLEHRIQELQPLAGRVDCWKGVDTRVESTREILDHLEKLSSAVAVLGSTSEVLVSLREGLEKIMKDANALLAPTAAIGRACAAAVQSWSELQRRLDGYSELAGVASHELVEAPSSGSWLGAVAQVMRELVQQRRYLRNWCAWRSAYAEAGEAGIGKFARAVEQGRIEESQVREMFELSYRRWWLEKVVDEDDLLRGFMREEYEDLLRTFRESDARHAQLTRRYIQARLEKALPDLEREAGASGLGVLKREMGKKRRHKPVRQLVSELGTDLSRIKPCLMMSPLSIAQYLPSEHPLFDLVIYDEASQITVWDAVDAVARGRQVVVVGDPKQLPPTSFFQRSDEEADETVEEDLESILDECLGAGLPKLDLRWHYRSEHESLITFSNYHYYEGGLITFPSPVTEDRAVCLNYLEKGVYDRGKSRTNRAEAEAIVEHVRGHLLGRDGTRPKSIGIVTLNTAQQDLIENLLDKERREYPELEQYFNYSEDYNEPVFVKNLESVQGDERDIILFSVNYGPDARGRLSMNFGPINNQGGERRLNVAITRARSELCVYSSMRSDHIDLSRSDARGVRDLKYFLDFAERGRRALAEAVQGSVGDVESPFEAAVVGRLRAKGWIVHSQVGVSSFRIDLGVVHPDRAGAYLAGIECDGATYHRSATARDRDIVREGILVRLGWKILRVWSTDWWFNAEQATEILHEELNRELEQSRRKAQEATERSRQAVEMPRKDLNRELRQSGGDAEEATRRRRQDTLMSHEDLNLELEQGRRDVEGAPRWSRQDTLMSHEDLNREPEHLELEQGRRDAEEAPRRRGRPPQFAGKRIFKLRKANPRREGTHGYRSWELLYDGMTYEEYLKAGGRRNDLQWDLDRNRVEVK